MKKLFVLLVSITCILLSCKTRSNINCFCSKPLIVKKSSDKWKDYDVHHYSDTCSYTCRPDESLDLCNDRDQYAVRYALRILYKQKKVDKHKIDSLEEVSSELRSEGFRIQRAKDDFEKFGE